MRLEGRFAADPSSLAAIRDEVASIAAQCGRDAEALSKIRLGVSEAVTLAIRQGQAHGADVFVEIELDPDEVRVIVGSRALIDTPPPGSPSLQWGLRLISEVARAEVVRNDHEHGAELRLVFPCPGTSETLEPFR